MAGEMVKEGEFSEGCAEKVLDPARDCRHKARTGRAAGGGDPRGDTGGPEIPPEIEAALREIERAIIVGRRTGTRPRRFLIVSRGPRAGTRQGRAWPGKAWQRTVGQGEATQFHGGEL